MSTSLNLFFEHSVSIRHKGEGLREPSGLAIDAEGNLWTVSDDSKCVFQIDIDGEIVDTIKIKDRGLEGICFSRAGEMLTVDEDDGSIVAVDASSGTTRSHPLCRMDGYDRIANDFSDNGNNGLEGITFDELRGQIVLIKEADPKLVIYVSEDLQRIEGFDRLKSKHGFRDPARRVKKLDVSGICHDISRDLFWIVSDKASAVFGFDRSQCRVVHSFALESGGKKIRKAEGVAVSNNGRQMFIVSDQAAELYRFRFER